MCLQFVRLIAFSRVKGLINCASCFYCQGLELKGDEKKRERKQKFLNGVSFTTQALALDPEAPSAYRFRGLCAYEIGDDATAKMDLRRYKSLHPTPDSRVDNVLKKLQIAEDRANKNVWAGIYDSSSNNQNTSTSIPVPNSNSNIEDVMSAFLSS